MFDNKLDIEASCLDPQCDGTFVVQFEGKIGGEECHSYCSDCEHGYTVLRNDWSDTPDDEIVWAIYS